MKRWMAIALALFMMLALTLAYAEPAAETQEDEDELIVEELSPETLKLLEEYQFDYLFAHEDEPYAFEFKLRADMPDMSIYIERLSTRETEQGRYYQYGLMLYETLAPEVLLQDIRYESTQSAMWSVWAVEDINFDGYLDLALVESLSDNGQSLLVYLWNPEQLAYERLDQSAHKLCWYELYPQARLILDEAPETAITGMTTLYAFEGGRLTPLRRVTRSYAVDNERRVEQRFMTYTSGGEQVVKTEMLDAAALSERLATYQDQAYEFLLEGYEIDGF